MIRYTHHMAAEDKLAVLLDALTVPQQRSLLRHPAWHQRCDCSRYGLPYAIPLTIIDADAAHTAELCQPRREWIDQRP